MIQNRMLAGLGACALAIAAAPAAKADAVSDFYKTQRMTMFVGSGAGGAAAARRHGSDASPGRHTTSDPRARPGWRRDDFRSLAK